MPNTLKIETSRLSIVPFSEEHLTQQYLNWLNDSEVMRYSDQRFKKHTLESCKNYMNSFKGTSNGFWAVIAHDVNLGHIGNLTTYVNTVHSVADIGILIGEKGVWGQGYGTEAWIAMCNYLFEVIKIRKITVGTLSVNIPMLKIIQKAGMIEDGRRRQQCLFEGREVDMVHAALFRENRKM